MDGNLTPPFRCVTCGRTLGPQDDVRICRSCYFQGKLWEPDFKGLLAELRAIPGVHSAALEHTGGGCWALIVRAAPDGPYVMGTEAFQDDPGWGWDTDSILPKDHDGPWAVGAYDAESEPAEGLDLLMPATHETFTAYVRGWMTKLTEAG